MGHHIQNNRGSFRKSIETFHYGARSGGEKRALFFGCWRSTDKHTQTHTHRMARRTSTKELSSARALSALSDGATNSKRPEIFSARFQCFGPSVCVCMCWGRGSSLPQLLLFLLLSNTFHIRVMPFVSGGFFVFSTYLVSGCLLDASSSYY